MLSSIENFFVAGLLYFALLSNWKGNHYGKCQMLSGILEAYHHIIKLASLKRTKITVKPFYSQVANRRGGRSLIFRNFSDPPPRSLLGPPRLLIFQKKVSDQEVFAIDLLYF